MHIGCFYVGFGFSCRGNGAEKAVVSTEKATEETQVKTDDSIKVVVDLKRDYFYRSSSHNQKMTEP